MKIKYLLLFLLFAHSNFSQKSKSLFSPSNNMVKIGIHEFLLGDVSLYYERVINKKLAAELGSGVVFKDYLKGFFQETPQSTSDKMLIGPSFDLKLKYYPNIPGESIYFCTDYKFRRYRTEYSTTSITGNFTLSFKEFSQRNIVRFGVGYLQCVDEHFCIDYFTCIGLTGVLDQNIVPQYDQSIQDYNYVKDFYRNTLLHFVAGVKFGFRF